MLGLHGGQARSLDLEKNYISIEISSVYEIRDMKRIYFFILKLYDVKERGSSGRSLFSVCVHVHMFRVFFLFFPFND